MLNGTGDMKIRAHLSAGPLTEHDSRGGALSCGLFTMAPPGGMVPREVANELMDTMIASIDPSVDGMLVVLHGAMVAEGFPDMEGEILGRIRAKLEKRIPVVATLDLHANISTRMVEQADILVGFDTYPHIDIYERVFEGVQLLARMIRQEIHPTSALVKPGILIAPQAMETCEAGPMKDMMELAFAMESDPGVLNVTIAGGFPYSDIPDAGVGIIVTTNGNPRLAEHYAEQLGRKAWSLRDKFICTASPPVEAVAAAIAETECPVILVEASDNVGGGGPGDATYVLEHLLHAPKTCLIVICDKEAVTVAHQLGVGGAFAAWVGGKRDHMHGKPVWLTGSVRLLFDGRFHHIGPYMAGHKVDMGKTAVIESGNVTMILTERRTMLFDRNLVNSVGLREESFHVIVVKSAVAWKSAFGDICKKIISVDSPGCCSSNLFHFEYENVKRPIYPLDSAAD